MANKSNKAKAIINLATNKAYEVNEVNEAVATNDTAYKADNQADKAGIADAEANEADAKANEVNSSDKAVEAEADKVDAADETDKADYAKAHEADEADKAIAINDTANKAHVIDEAVASDVAIEANAVDQADVANDQVVAVGAGAADGTDASVVADEVDASVLVDNVQAANVNKTDKANEANDAGVFIKTPLLLPFSLTKHSAIFAEVKGCFGNIKQLERFVGNGG